MSSIPSYQQLGVDAMSSCFISSRMINSEAPLFHPSMPHDASYGFGDPAGGGGGGADAAAHFMANNTMTMASPAGQVLWAAPFQDSHQASMSEEEMNDAYAAVASESCTTVHSMLPTACSAGSFQYGPSDVTIAQPSKMAKLTGEPHCSWMIYDGPSAAAIHEPFYQEGFTGAGFLNPPASELSLRLGARSSSVTMASLPDQSSEVSCSGLTHVNSNGFGYQQHQPVKAHAGSALFQPPYGGVDLAGDELRQVFPQMMCSRPPHFSQVLPRSRYTVIAQEMLNGVVACLLNGVAEITGSVGGIGSEESLLLSSSCSARTPTSAASSNRLMFPPEEHPRGAADRGRLMEAQKMRSDLLKLLQMMDQRCNLCFDDIQSTAAKFSSMVVAPPFAHHAVSVMHRRLRKRVMSLITALAERSSRGEPSLVLAEKERSWESSFIQKHWALQQLRRSDQQSWRPQRGLPEKSVAVLKAWMFENFLRPYPKDNEKDMLAARSGLSRSQVSNWFINARVRLWKPMIEEMYEELKRTSGGAGDGVAVEHLSSKGVVS